jgi:hypothetical protein
MKEISKSMLKAYFTRIFRKLKDKTKQNEIGLID